MRFLSPEWLDHLASAATPAPPEVSLSIHQRITGGPDGDVEFTLWIYDGAVSVEPGPGRADIEIVEDYETAVAISQGQLSPASAFATERLTLRGPASLLIANQEALTAVGAGMTGSAEITY